MSAAAAAIWEIQWRRTTPQLAPVDTGGDSSGTVDRVTDMDVYTAPDK